MSWTKHGYGSLGALELSCIILAFIVIAIGFMALTSEKKGLIVLFIILSFFSALFVIGVAIFCLIATKTRYWKDYLGCTGNYKGLLSVWNSVDTYLQVVDQYFCGKNCPCFFGPKLTKLYTANSTTAPYYHIWEKQEFNDDNIKRKNIDNCIDSIDTNSKDAKSEKEELYKKLKEKYLTRNAYFNHTFKVDWFHTYYKHIEEHFKCTGFCSITYFNDETNTNQKIVKYLFSDMTKEIPEHFGCIGAIMDWLRKTLIAFAIIGLFLFLTLITLFVVGLLLLGGGKVEEEEGEVGEEREGEGEEEEEKKDEEKKDEDEEHKDSKSGTISISDDKDGPEKENIQKSNLPNTSFIATDEQLNEKDKDIIFCPSLLKP
jgi:hypothetical protein